MLVHVSFFYLAEFMEFRLLRCILHMFFEGFWREKYICEGKYIQLIGVATSLSFTIRVRATVKIIQKTYFFPSRMCMQNTALDSVFAQTIMHIQRYGNR